jgi:tRNA(Ile)-lysidine synthase
VRLRRGPALERAIPGFRSALLGALPALRAQREAIDALARDDLAHAHLGEGALERRALAPLPPDRLAAALRRWIADLGMRAPTRSRLAQMADQLVGGRGAYGCVRHEGADFVRYRDRIEVRASWPLEGGARVSPGARAPEAAGAAVLARLRWGGEPALELPGTGGCLVFTPDSAHPGREPGVSAEWLRRCTLEVRPGASSPRLRLHANGCSHTMKNLYQGHGVPAWVRPTLPLVYADSRLLYAAGFGMDRGANWPREGDTVSIRWETGLDGDPRRAFCAPHHL